MTRILILFLLTCQLSFSQTHTGIEVLRNDGFKPLVGKRIGLITNPTGIDSRLISTIDILHQAQGVQLAALFAPEHGVRGNHYAGANVNDERDPLTGVRVYSLHGKTKKPTPEMLRGIDILVYDIQDIGCRSYTFISTLGLAMEAAAENNIEFMILDRPNPLGGLKIEGGGVSKECRSFVSAYNIPYLYGLTPGELGQLLNGERMTTKRCKLTVIPLKGWNRKMLFGDTGLPWVLPSPHIPQPQTALYYPATGIVGELGTLSIGVGYTLPFQVFVKDSISGPLLADALNNLNLPGVRFRPIYLKPFYAWGQGKQLEGVQIHITDFKAVRLQEIQFYFAQELKRLYPQFNIFGKSNKTQLRMFDNVIGNKRIREKFTQNYQVKEILPLLRKGETEFQKTAKQYWLYE